jgi:hypothetical protein
MVLTGLGKKNTVYCFVIQCQLMSVHDIIYKGGNPLTVLSSQVSMELHKINQRCPLFETNGRSVSEKIF